MKTFVCQVVFAMMISFFSLVLVSCKNSSSTNTAGTGSDYSESGQQVLDAASSIDEMGAGGSTISSIRSLSNKLEFQKDTEAFRRLFHRYGEDFQSVDEESEFRREGEYTTSAACAGTGFSACSSNVITRTFNDCTVRSATFSGSLTLTWEGSSANCVMTATGASVARKPVGTGYTVTGLRGATLTVSATGSVGQKLTWQSGSYGSRVFEFTNDGIRRVFRTAGGATLFDLTTETTSAVTVTGGSRSGRVMNGGSIRVTDNTKTPATYCDFSPSNVTWTSTCNCPTSGSFTGTCSGGESASLTINSCTSGTITAGTSSADITFDRCYGL